MDFPTFGGVTALQRLFAGTEFPLPDFRVNVCTRRVWKCGFARYDFSEGVPGDLASCDPAGNAVGTALCSLEGGYGVRFVMNYYIHDFCHLSYEYEQIPVMARLADLSPYGPDAFQRIVNERHRECIDIVRYGAYRPDLFDRAGDFIARLRRTFARAQ